MSHWSKGPRAEEIKEKLRVAALSGDNHWSRRSDRDQVRQRMKENHWSRGPKREVALAGIAASNHDRTWGPEQRKKFIAAMAGRIMPEEHRQKLRVPKSLEARQRMKDNHHSLRIGPEAYRAKILKSRTPEVCFAIAEAVRAGRSGYKTARWTVFQDRKGRKFRMRSTWEALTAAWLDLRGYDWEFEPETLRLSVGRSYLPDFKLADGRYIEVKGYMSPKAEAKIKQARIDGHRVILLNERGLRLLGVLDHAGN